MIMMMMMTMINDNCGNGGGSVGCRCGDDYFKTEDYLYNDDN